MTTIAPERWLPVVGWEEIYEVSDQGRVRRTKRTMGTSGGVLRGTTDRHGYPIVDLRDRDRRRNAKVHRLVAEAYLGPTPPGQEVRHLNGDPSDSRLVNLAYGTHAENMRDMVAHQRTAVFRVFTCPNGHPYDASNTWVDGRGARNCRTCCTARASRWRRAKRDHDRALGLDPAYAIRQWGRARGFRVGSTGRISNALIQAHARALASERAT